MYTSRIPYQTLTEWATDRADMRIVCTCGRTINIPSGQIIPRFRFDGEIAKAVTRLRCKTCRRRGHATVESVPVVRR